MTTALPGPMTGLRRLIDRAMAADLTAFVVPDVQVARAVGLDPAAAGLRVVANPRRASVLLIVHTLTGELSRAAATVYAQMPRPRGIVVVGVAGPDWLPNGAIVTALGQTGLAEGIRRLRDALATGAWSADTTPFSPHAPVAHATDVPASKHDDGSSSSGAGHEVDVNLVVCQPSTVGSRRGRSRWEALPSPGPVGDDAASAVARRRGAGEGSREGSVPGQAISPDKPIDQRHSLVDDDPGQPNLSGNSDQHAAMDHSAMHHADNDQGGMDHSGMDHGGFMSMVAMTEGTPRSRDGLQMEWVEAPFGPLFSGLPAGLNLTLTLDGDTVARAEAASAVAGKPRDASLPWPAADLPDLLAGLDPLSPMAYRLLALRALEAANGATGAATNAAWIGALERERVASHLGWLASFGELMGVRWLADRAGELGLAVVRADTNAIVLALRDPIDRFTRRAERLPLLGQRLHGIGHLDSTAATIATGPVARGMGLRWDARTDDPGYVAAGFRPVVRPGGDARSRLAVRLAEVRQSLALINGTGATSLTTTPASQFSSGSGSAMVETPRGAARLTITIAKGYVERVRLDPPSVAHLALVPVVAEGAELADALVGIASLDLSPWAVRP